MNDYEYITEDFAKLANRKSITKYYQECRFSLVRNNDGSIAIEHYWDLPERTLNLICKEIQRIYNLKPIGEYVFVPKDWRVINFSDYNFSKTI